MKLGPLFSLLSAAEGAGRYLVEKDEASEFLSRQGKLFMINWDITSLYIFVYSVVTHTFYCNGREPTYLIFN